MRGLGGITVVPCSLLSPDQPPLLIGNTLLAPKVTPLAAAGVRARRIVRHGLADVLTWLGEDVGAQPADPVGPEHVLGWVR